MISLGGLAVDRDGKWEPHSALRGTVGAGFGHHKVQLSTGHVACLIAAICAVGSIIAILKEKRFKLMVDRPYALLFLFSLRSML